MVLASCYITRHVALPATSRLHSVDVISTWYLTVWLGKLITITRGNQHTTSEVRVAVHWLLQCICQVCWVFDLVTLTVDCFSCASCWHVVLCGHNNFREPEDCMTIFLWVMVHFWPWLYEAWWDWYLTFWPIKCPELHFLCATSIQIITVYILHHFVHQL